MKSLSDNMLPDLPGVKVERVHITAAVTVAPNYPLVLLTERRGGEEVTYSQGQLLITFSRPAGGEWQLKSVQPLSPAGVFQRSLREDEDGVGILFRLANALMASELS